MKTRLLQKKINTLGKKKILKHHSVKQAVMLPYFADTKQTLKNELTENFDKISQKTPTIEFYICIKSNYTL